MTRGHWIRSLVATGALLSQETQQPGAKRPEITRAEIEAHVRFLASDELDGRATGSEGAKAAARYLAAVLEACGVAPAGEDGSYLQPVRLVRRRMKALPELTLRTRAGETLTAVYGRDFDVSRAAIEVRDARIAIAKSVDEITDQSPGSVALCLDPAPPRSRRTEADFAREERFAVSIEAGSSQAGKEKALDADPGPLQRATAARRWVRLRGPLVERLRKGELAGLSLSTHVEEEPVPAWNVVARIDARPGAAGPGGEGAAPPEALVLSAHYDHLPGRRRSGSSGPDVETADRVFNGADDDASGCAAVLELAGALAAAPRPARTIVFLLATGEEIGLLGTREYLDRPVVPLERTVANLNFEMIGRPDPLVGGAGIQWLTGFELSNLGPALRDAGVAVKADPRPDQHFFERSDNYAFVMRGIVGQTFSTYNLHEDYHTPSDEADRLDYAHMETCVRTALEAVRLVAEDRLRPRWLEGRDPTRRER